MSPWLFVAIGAFVSATDFAVGLYLARRGPEEPALDGEGNARLSAEAANRAGRLIMLVSPLPLIVLAVIGFVLFGAEGGQ